MRPTTGTGERQGYASALAGLWTGLSGALARLEELAASPEERLADPDALELLPGLQYALHSAGEIVVGIDPPTGAESAHAELAAALADARDATGEVVEALQLGGVEAAEPLVLEWRGALFRVRLARLRLGGAPRRPARERSSSRSLPPLSVAAAAVLLALGMTAFASGALAGVWPVWATGLALVAAGLGASRA